MQKIENKLIVKKHLRKWMKRAVLLFVIVFMILFSSLPSLEEEATSNEAH